MSQFKFDERTAEPPLRSAGSTLCNGVFRIAHDCTVAVAQSAPAIDACLSPFFSVSSGPTKDVTLRVCLARLQVETQERSQLL